MTRLETDRTALLVMDFQNDIVDPEGKWGAEGLGFRIARAGTIQRTVQAVQAARAAGIEVIHVGLAWREGYPEAHRAVPLFSDAPAAGMLKEGTWGADFHPQLRPAPGEIVIRKRSVSALAGTELDRLLRLKGINTLVLAGIVTNFVVEGTARDAVDRGYSVVVLADCCESLSDDMHAFSVQTLLPLLATVMTASDFTAMREGPCTRALTEAASA